MHLKNNRSKSSELKQIPSFCRPGEAKTGRQNDEGELPSATKRESIPAEGPAQFWPRDPVGARRAARLWIESLG